MFTSQPGSDNRYDKGYACDDEHCFDDVNLYETEPNTSCEGIDTGGNRKAN